MQTSPDTPDCVITFEAAIARLEEIIRQLEGGTAPLDTSLALYEEGVSLVRKCGSMLDNAEQKIKLLVKNQDGTYDEQDFKASQG
ncbi:MAG: exodeoxyribonuclease VII small subunit [Eubacteriales bacterium]